MLSSKQGHKSSKDMAPEPTGLFSKMRKTCKSLSGKHYLRNSDSVGQSQSVTIPQMDRDTAIPYMRDPSFDKTRPCSGAAVMTSNHGHGRNSERDSTVNGPVHMNGNIPNGSHVVVDENANKAAERESHVGSKQPEVSIFERQGARPKVRKSSKDDETNNAFDKSAFIEGMCGTQSAGEPTCVEMAQPHFPVLEANCKSCSTSRRESQPSSTERPSGERRANSHSALQTPIIQGWFHPPPPSDPVPDVPPRSGLALPISGLSLTETEFGTEIQKSSLVTSNQLKSKTSDQQMLSERACSETNQSKIERPMSAPLDIFHDPQVLASMPSSVENADPTPEFSLPSTQSSDFWESGNEDVKYTSSSGLKQAEKHVHPNSLKPSTADLVQTPATLNPSQAPCDEDYTSSDTEEQTKHVSNPQKESDIVANNNTEGYLNSDSGGVINETSGETIVDSVPAVGVESLSKPSIEKQASAAEEGVTRHCCTCTCNRSKGESHADAPSRSNSHAKSALTLDGIPPDVDSSSGGSPKAPRTPHIALVINSNDLFSDEKARNKALSEQDLHMMLDWSALSLQSDSHEAAKKEEKNLKVLREMCYGETAQAIHALNLSQEATTRNSPNTSHHVNSENSQDILGATGGSVSALPRTKAPLVDRSCKPKDLGAVANDDYMEEPPPLPPRLPSVKKRDPFAAYPIFDDEDDFPTHEFLDDIRMDIYTDPKTAMKSKSLPRDTTPSHQSASPPELRAAKRGKTVNMRNRFSQIFKPGSKKKRHSTHGFPDRPLPDIPLNPRLPRARENTTQNNPPVFGTATGDIVTQQAVKEGLLRETPTKEEVDKSREQFAVSLRRISEYGWYWGPMSWDDAETRLERMPDGSFLVRDSSDDRHLLSLSFRAQGSTHHTRVEHHNGKFSFWSQPCSHGSSSIVEFVEEAMRHSHSGRVLYFLRPRMPGYPPAAVQLLYPISRFQKSRSLQHMCRFVIRKHVRLDHIDNLPLPRRLREYLKEAQYYTQEDILH